MPIVETLMNALTARYGRDEGERTYYAMEAEGKGPFGPRGKYRQLHLDFAEKHGLSAIERVGSAKRPATTKGKRRKHP